LFFVRFENTQKPVLALLLAVFSLTALTAQVDAYFSIGKFNTPSNESFVETYMTLVGQSLASKNIDDKLQSSVNVFVKIFKDSVVVKAAKYNIIGPAFLTPTNSPSFIDNQRYILPNGNYHLELVLRDNYDSTKKPLLIKSEITLDFNTKDMQGSSIQALESFKKSNGGPISKSGFDLIPYTVNYYPESSNTLCFYFEAYNAHKVLGEDKPFLFSYYLESSDNLTKLNSYGSFKKDRTSGINPLLAKMDITKLGTGNYNLVIELRDTTNKLQLQKKYFFQRLNRAVDITELQNISEKQNIAQYIGSCNNADTLKMFVECLWPIADGVDKERIINQAIKKDPTLMKNFIVDFWQRRAADTANPLKLWAKYYKSVQQVMILFKCGKQKGYYTDRGRVYLQYGPPSQRAVQTTESNTFPYEIWQYYRTTDQVNGQFFSNRKFVFVNKMLGDDCYMLIHSDMRGEINNPRWQFEVTRRNNNGLANPDNTVPAGTQLNQFNDLYSNPR
jgi:GWxTD domain-containing protein